MGLMESHKEIYLSNFSFSKLMIQIEKQIKYVLLKMKDTYTGFFLKGGKNSFVGKVHQLFVTYKWGEIIGHNGCQCVSNLAPKDVI